MSPNVMASSGAVFIKEKSDYLLHRYPSANTMQAQLVRRLADAEQGNPFGRCKAIAGKGLDGELLSVMLAYHRQASDAALHGVVL